jgi:hypothetical protein
MKNKAPNWGRFLQGVVRIVYIVWPCTLICIVYYVCMSSNIHLLMYVYVCVDDGWTHQSIEREKQTIKLILTPGGRGSQFKHRGLIYSCG